jgi:hypothetical protein
VHTALVWTHAHACISGGPPVPDAIVIAWHTSPTWHVPPQVGKMLLPQPGRVVAVVVVVVELVVVVVVGHTAVTMAPRVG